MSLDEIDPKTPGYGKIFNFIRIKMIQIDLCIAGTNFPRIKPLFGLNRKIQHDRLHPIDEITIAASLGEINQKPMSHHPAIEINKSQTNSIENQKETQLKWKLTKFF